jgi:type VI secretion system protein ImpE
MMSAQELLRDGKLQDAIQMLGSELRDQPTDKRRRTFLFELLCFAGDYDRAERHLNVLSEGSKEAGLGALLYRSALAAERQRQVFFNTKQYGVPGTSWAGHRTGKLNGEPFHTIEDIDPRIGPRLELFVAGEYMWLPFEHISAVTIEAPQRLRDLMWASARVTAGASLKGQEMGEVLVPVLYPFSWRHERETVRLGRETDFVLIGEDTWETPFGQKMLVLDSERTVSFLEIRSLVFDEPLPGPDISPTN